MAFSNLTARIGRLTVEQWCQQLPPMKIVPTITELQARQQHSDAGRAHSLAQSSLVLRLGLLSQSKSTATAP